jgi:hypothetical protein
MVLSPLFGSLYQMVFFALQAAVFKFWFWFCDVWVLLLCWWSVCLRRFGGSLTVLAFPCFVIGLLASPLCGAALTFFAAAKKVSKESGLKPPVLRCPSLL